MQPVVRDRRGVYRFKVNMIVRYLLDQCRKHGIDMNELAIVPFAQEDRVQFAQLIGYSVDGAADLSYMPRPLIAKADRMIKRMQKA